MADLLSALSKIMARATGIDAQVEGLTRLSGGANMESSAFDFGGSGYVLRRAPSLEMMANRPLAHKTEAAVIRAAFAKGVRAPEVIAELAPHDDIGSGYIMRRAMGEVNPAQILANPPEGLIKSIARELALIHSIEPREDLDIPNLTARQSLDLLKARYISYGADRPILALALKWLEDHLPDPPSPRLVHGDFRMGNLMVDDTGIAAVLDWEMAQWGDPYEDLAFGCLTVWRFGHIDKPAYGVADLETFFAAYEAESGTKIDRARFRFWLIYRTFWWALGCMQMADFWRRNEARDLERVVIGRRLSEQELDLLLLLEEEAPKTQRLPFRADAPPGARRQGEPSTVEMLEAVREWVESDVKAKAQGRDKFMAAVAMNALGMLIREAEVPVAPYDKALCDDILAGRASLATPGLLTRLRKAVLTKLANDSPKYAALAKARALWVTG